MLVHTEASAQPGAIERLAQLDRWTLLCGADDAAIIGAYRTIKRICDADPANTTKQVGAMVMGSDEHTARAAAEKLSSATQPVLQTPARFLGCQRRMMPVNLRQLGRFGPTETLWPQLATWLDELNQHETPLASPLTPAEPSAPSDAHEAAEAEPDFSDATVSAGTTRADWQWLREGESDTSNAQSQPQAQPEQPAPTEPAPAPEAQETEAPSSDTNDEPDLATFLTARSGALAGGLALEARCPQQPKTQLVLDQAGRLHLLRRHASADDTERDAHDTLRAAVVDLLEARRWVREHVQLLQLTQRQCSFDADAEPALHLFTDRADLATGLASRLGATLHLHLLQPVRVGDQSTWFCTPMQ